jgi:hypothetical protein
VPVTVRGADDAEVEVLRIEENLRRRILKPSETAKAIRRLFRLHGVANGGDRGDATLIRDQSRMSALEEVAAKAGYSAPQARAYRTLANLIPPLMAPLDAGLLTQKVGLQIAQMDAEDQAALPIYEAL